MVGIDICEDEKLNKGLGTESLGLWVGLFRQSRFPRAASFSFEPRASQSCWKVVESGKAGALSFG